MAYSFFSSVQTFRLSLDSWNRVVSYRIKWEGKCGLCIFYSFLIFPWIHYSAIILSVYNIVLVSFVFFFQFPHAIILTFLLFFIQLFISLWSFTFSISESTQLIYIFSLYSLTFFPTYILNYFTFKKCIRNKTSE